MAFISGTLGHIICSISRDTCHSSSETHHFETILLREISLLYIQKLLNAEVLNRRSPEVTSGCHVMLGPYYFQIFSCRTSKNFRSPKCRSTQHSSTKTCGSHLVLTRGIHLALTYGIHFRHLGARYLLNFK
jgi:hypothetical protein